MVPTQRVPPIKGDLCGSCYPLWTLERETQALAVSAPIVPSHAFVSPIDLVKIYGPQEREKDASELSPLGHLKKRGSFHHLSKGNINSAGLPNIGGSVETLSELLAGSGRLQVKPTLHGSHTALPQDKRNPAPPPKKKKHKKTSVLLESL